MTAEGAGRSSTQILTHQAAGYFFAGIPYTVCVSSFDPCWMACRAWPAPGSVDSPPWRAKKAFMEERTLHYGLGWMFTHAFRVED